MSISVMSDLHLLLCPGIPTVKHMFYEMAHAWSSICGLRPETLEEFLPLAAFAKNRSVNIPPKLFDVVTTTLNVIYTFNLQLKQQSQFMKLLTNMYQLAFPAHVTK